MPVPRLRLLVPSVALVAGLALAPTLSAVAAPHAPLASADAGAVVRLTEAERVLDAGVQRIPDSGTRSLPGDAAAPPLWLLLLLAPILLGGGIATGVTLRRLG